MVSAFPASNPSIHVVLDHELLASQADGRLHVLISMSHHAGTLTDNTLEAAVAHSSQHRSHKHPQEVMCMAENKGMLRIFFIQAIIEMKNRFCSATAIIFPRAAQGGGASKTSEAEKERSLYDAESSHFSQPIKIKMGGEMG